MRRVSRRMAIAAAGTALLVAACTSGATQAPSTVPSASGLPSAEPSPSASSSPSAAGSAGASAGPSPSAPTPVASAMATTGHIVDATGGFELTLPDNWRSLDLSGNASATEAASLAGLLGTSTVDAQTYLEALHAMLPAGIRLFALDTATFDPAAKFTASLNVLRFPAPAATLDQLESESVAQLEAVSIVVKPVDHVRVTLPSGPAVRVTYGLRVANSGIANGVIQMTQHVILAAGVEYVITLGTAGPPTRQEQADLLAITRSFAVLP